MGVDELVAEVERLEDVVRDHINTGRYQSDLLKNSRNWNQICSSLDVIGDTTFAITSYLSSQYPGEAGLKYIFTYGILQAIFIQQDALENLSEAFDLKYERPAALRRIRNIRNASIGHPSKQDAGKERFYNFISRMTLSKDGFDLLRHSDSKSYEAVSVDIPRIIEEQLSEIVAGYAQIVEKLRMSDIEHKAKFKNQPLVDCFPNGMRYLIQKIGEGIYSGRDDYAAMAKMHLDMVTEIYENFRAALKERNELNEYLDYDLKAFLHALSRIDSYISGGNEFFNESDARIYHSYVSNEHKSFVEIAKQIDEQYQEKT